MSKCMGNSESKDLKRVKSARPRHTKGLGSISVVMTFIKAFSEPEFQDGSGHKNCWVSVLPVATGPRGLQRSSCFVISTTAKPWPRPLAGLHLPSYHSPRTQCSRKQTLYGSRCPQSELTFSQSDILQPSDTSLILPSQPSLGFLAEPCPMVAPLFPKILCKLQVQKVRSKVHNTEIWANTTHRS